MGAFIRNSVAQRFRDASELAQGALSSVAGLALLFLSSGYFYGLQAARPLVEDGHWWSVAAFVLLVVALLLFIVVVAVSAILLVGGAFIAVRSAFYILKGD